MTLKFPLVFLGCLLVLSLEAKASSLSRDRSTREVETHVNSHHRSKRFWGAVFGMARVAAQAGARAAANAARIGSQAAHGAARAGLGAARFGANAGQGVIRAGANAGARAGNGVAQVGRLGTRRITELARSGFNFVAKNPKRVAAELLLVGAQVGVSHALAPEHPNYEPPTPDTPGQNFVVDCTEGWSHLGANGQCYAKAPEAKSFTDAENICGMAYASLALVNTSAENAKVVEVMNSTDTCWIGLTDVAVEGVFRWQNDESLTYINWEAGQPGTGNLKDFEDCVLINNAGKWESKYCMQQSGFVCQTPEVRAFDVFQTGSYEWELVFRGTPGVRQPVYEAFVNYQSEMVEPGCRQVLSHDQCSNHYRNNFALDSWSYVDEVALVLYKNGESVAHVVFDGQGSSSTSWLQQSKVKRSSFRDIHESGNVFSLEGHATRERRFFMSHSYNGCDRDSGWIVAVGAPNCSWERRYTNFPRFLYAKNGNKSTWNSDSEVGDADVMAVFVKYAVPT